MQEVCNGLIFLAYIQVTAEAKLMWYETIYTVLCFFERNLLLPIYIMNELTKQAVPINNLYGEG